MVVTTSSSVRKKSNNTYCIIPVFIILLSIFNIFGTKRILIETSYYNTTFLWSSSISTNILFQQQEVIHRRNNSNNIPKKLSNNNITTTTPNTTSTTNNNKQQRIYTKKKQIDLNVLCSTEKKVEQYPNRTIVHMHVGKCGGMTLNKYVLAAGCCSLQSGDYRMDCFNYVKIKESMLSKLVLLDVHMTVRKNKRKIISDTNSNFLFTIREPISRFESWFRYSSNRYCSNKTIADKDILPIQYHVWYKCFCDNSMDTMAQMLEPTTPTNYYSNNNITNTTTTKTMDDDCRMLVRDAFTKVGVTFFGHLAANYRYYYQQAQLDTMHKDAIVYAIRTEHLWSDLVAVDKMVGGDGNFSSSVQGKKEDHGSSLYKKETLSTDRNIFLVCCALREDIIAYRSIIEKASNLNVIEKQRMYELTWNKCNVTSWEMLDEKCHNATILPW